MLRKIFFISLMMIMPSSFINSQTYDFKTIEYHISSGVFDVNTTGEIQKVFESTIYIQNAIWIRLAYSEVNLGSNSFLRIFVEEDEIETDYYQNMIQNFNFTSPYFNGNKITLSLHHHPEDEGIYFTIDSILILVKIIDNEIPVCFKLLQNYPNPFNSSAVISYHLPEDSNVKLIVYDILGNEVATLLDEFREIGKYKVTFVASNLASGVYIYKLQAGEYVSSKKMILIK